MARRSKFLHVFNLFLGDELLHVRYEGHYSIFSLNIVYKSLMSMKPIDFQGTRDEMTNTDRPIYGFTAGTATTDNLFQIVSY